MSSRQKQTAPSQGQINKGQSPTAVDSASSAADREAPGGGHNRTWLGRYGPYVLLAVILVLVMLVRLRVADVPLERDEGEYAYAAQLILQGIPPYELAYNMKFPGTYYAYALILAVFGETAWGIHIGLMFLNLATSLVLFFLLRRFFGTFPAAVGVAGFAVLALDRWILGVFAHATHFILLPALAGLLLLLNSMDSRRQAGIFGAGILLGIAVLMKQHAIFFLLLAGCMILWQEWQQQPGRVKRIAISGSLLGAGAAVPVTVVIVLLAAQGVLGRFWFWTFQYASTYVSQIPVSLAWPSFTNGWKTVTQTNLPLWLFSGFGLLMLWAGRWPLGTKMFVTAFVGFSFLTLIPGFFFRPHYFILLLPAAACGMAVAVSFIEKDLLPHIPGVVAQAIGAALFLVLVGAYALHERAYLTAMTPRELSRSRYGANPFPEAVEIARYLREHTAEDDRIAVLGSEPEIFFYANRKSATGYIYTYALMEPQPYASMMQEEMMNEIEDGRPKYLVLVDIRTSWLARPSSDTRILEWMTRYWQACYDVVGVTDIVSNDTTIYRWDDEATGYEPQTEHRIYTLRRKNSDPCHARRD